MDRVHSLLTWYPEPVSRFTSLPLQASPASLPPASAPALLLPCAAALVHASRHPSARCRDPRLLLLFRAVAPVRRGPRLPACRHSCWCCPASAVGRGRACANLSRRAAAPAHALARACCRLATASGGRRNSPSCRLLPLPTPGVALWLISPLLCFARGSRARSSAREGRLGAEESSVFFYFAFGLVVSLHSELGWLQVQILNRLLVCILSLVGSDSTMSSDFQWH